MRPWIFLSVALAVLTLLPAVAPAQEADPAGHPCPPPLGRILKQADADHDGTVTFDELAVVMPNLTQEQFDRLDRNDDGVLTTQDVPWHQRRGFLRKLGHADTDGDCSVSFEEAVAEFPRMTETVFNRLDRNDDGVLNHEDCLPVCRPNQP